MSTPEICSKVPLYDQEGHLKAWLSPNRLDFLMNAGRVRVVRNRVKAPKAAYELDSNPRFSLRTPPYSYLESSGDVPARSWTLRRLGRARGWNFASPEVRTIFLAVVLGCLVEK